MYDATLSIIMKISDKIKHKGPNLDCIPCAISMNVEYNKYEICAEFDFLVPFKNHGLFLSWVPNFIGPKLPLKLFITLSHLSLQESSSTR